MFICGKRNRSKSDISKAAKMAEGSKVSGVSATTEMSGHCLGDQFNGDMNNISQTTTTSASIMVNTTSLSNDNHNCTNISNNRSSRRPFERFSCSRCCNNLFNYLLRLRVSPEEIEQRYKSREIDKFLEKDKHTFRRQVGYLVFQLMLVCLVDCQNRIEFIQCASNVCIWIEAESIACDANANVNNFHLPNMALVFSIRQKKLKRSHDFVRYSSSKVPPNKPKITCFRKHEHYDQCLHWTVPKCRVTHDTSASVDEKWSNLSFLRLKLKRGNW